MIGIHKEDKPKIASSHYLPPAIIRLLNELRDDQEYFTQGKTIQYSWTTHSEISISIR